MLADTSVWIDHLRNGNKHLIQLLNDGKVYCHEFIIGELSCGNIKKREEFFYNLIRLPLLKTVSHKEALYFLNFHKLSGKEIGWVDVHLLAAAYMNDAAIFTVDKKLKYISELLKISFQTK